MNAKEIIELIKTEVPDLDITDKVKIVEAITSTEENWNQAVIDEYKKVVKMRLTTT
jgi:hypothetical protein